MPYIHVNALYHSHTVIVSLSLYSKELTGFSSNGGGCRSLDDNWRHIGGTVRLLTTGFIDILNQLTTWVQICDSWASVGYENSHMLA